MLNFETLTNAQYLALRFSMLRELEGEETGIALDSLGRTTIGIGFDLATAFVLDRVLQELGLVRGNAADDPHIANIDAALAAGGSEAAIQTSLNTAMANAAADPATTVTQNTFTLDVAQMKKVFDDIVSTFETNIDDVFFDVTIPESYERAVLFSLAYNAKTDNFDLNGNGSNVVVPRTLGHGLRSAINHVNAADRDRAEAWFEIRYNSQSLQFERRRLVESHLFAYLGTVYN